MLSKFSLTLTKRCLQKICGLIKMIKSTNRSNITTMIKITILVNISHKDKFAS